MHKSLELTDRVAVVIGGTSGLGRAIAAGLAVSGAHVVPSGRRADSVRLACAEIEAAGRRTLRQPVDVSDCGSVDKLVNAIISAFNGVDIVVNAAGQTFRKPTHELLEPEWAGLMDANLTGMLRVCQSFYPALKASGRGRVINIASLGSFVAFRDVAAYCASKTGVLSLTRSLAIEWARDSISVNAIAPGVFPTDLNRELVLNTPRGKELLMRTPMGRFGRPEELVGAAILLASDAASYITGQCITVDGGILASGVNC